MILDSIPAHQIPSPSSPRACSVLFLYSRSQGCVSSCIPLLGQRKEGSGTMSKQTFLLLAKPGPAATHSCKPCLWVPDPGEEESGQMCKPGESLGLESRLCKQDFVLDFCPLCWEATEGPESIQLEPTRWLLCPHGGH